MSTKHRQVTHNPNLQIPSPPPPCSSHPDRRRHSPSRYGAGTIPKQGTNQGARSLAQDRRWSPSVTSRYLRDRHDTLDVAWSVFAPTFTVVEVLAWADLVLPLRCPEIASENLDITPPLLAADDTTSIVHGSGRSDSSTDLSRGHRSTTHATMGFLSNLKGSAPVALAPTIEHRSADEKSLVRRLDCFLMVFGCLSQVIKYLDQQNINNAVCLFPPSPSSSRV